MLNRILVAGGLLVMLGGAAYGQPAKAVVHVSHTGEDQVGRALVYEIREALRRSAGYQVGTWDDAIFVVSVVSLDTATGSQSKGQQSAIAVTYTMTNNLPYRSGDPQTWYPIFLTASAHLVGSERAEPSAKSIAAALDAAVEKFRADSRK